jgi:hypothetical protein
MDVRDKINNGTYENRIPYPIKPRKPIISLKAASPAEIRAHADDVETYDRETEGWKTATEEYRRETSELMLKFRADVEAEQGTVLNKKAALLWNKAWERGHDEGLLGVLNAYEDLVDLIL